MIINALPPFEQETLAPDQRLPVLLLAQYLHFLSRRPISESNLHYLLSRLRGLQSLAAVFEGSPHPVLARLVRQLAQLHPGAFRRVAPMLQLSLLPVLRGALELPDDVVVDDVAPAESWWKEARRALVVFGPGIGIGDELMVAPLPRWLKAANGDLSISTLSAYRGFWDRVDGVDRSLQYSTHADLLLALRGEPPYDGMDVVVFIDFETPELYRAIAADCRVRRYAEISIGSRSAFLFDAERRWLHRVHHIRPYFNNFYHALHQTLRGLGLNAHAPEHFTGVVRRAAAEATDGIDIFVTPFTSKYDPSTAFWARLLSQVMRGTGATPMRLHLDTGNTWRTRRFAIELARALAAFSPHVDVRLARDATPPALSLSGVYDALDRCHAVICADSFAAHAGPLFGCLTMVLAKSDLKPWQVPYDRSFYFDPASPVDRTADAMADLVNQIWRPKDVLGVETAFSRAELDLARLGTTLEGWLPRAGGDAEFLETYRAFAARYRAVADWRTRHQAPPIFADSFALPMRAPDDGAATSGRGMQLHLRDQLERWQNTNFSKYVRLAVRGATEDAAREAHDDGEWAAPPQEADSNGAGALARVLVGGMRAVLREQLPTGEMPTYFRIGGGALEYRRTPLLSSFVHDALATFDLRSRWVDTDFLDTLPRDVHGRFVRAATLTRSRIRSFLLWEEANRGGWRFNGRSAGEGVDADTTACAGAAVLQSPRRRPQPRARTHAELIRLRLDVHEDGDLDLVTRVNAVRFLALAGEPVADAAAAVLAALRRGEPFAAGRYAHPLAPAFCVTRAWAHGALPGRSEIADLLLPRILERADEAQPFGGALGAAFALNALLDLEYGGPEIIAAAHYLLESALPRGGWQYGALLENGGGAPALSTALAMSALARSGVAR